jgi:hypothetical protein
MTNNAMREEIIFITNTVRSGSTFAKCQSDGTGVYIPAAVFAKYGKGRDIGDAMLAMMIPNLNDPRGELPLLVVSMTTPIGNFDDEQSKATQAATDDQVTKLVSILMDDDYDDRWFSVDDMLVELSLPETKANIKSVKAQLDLLCDQGVCAHITSRLGSAVREWYTSDVIKPE